MNWAGELRAGEDVLWHGRPDPAVQPGQRADLEPWRRVGLTVLIVGICLLLVVTIGPTLWGHPFYVAVMLLFVATLLGALGYFLWWKPRIDAFWRARTWYALTNLRALTAIRALGRFWVRRYRLRPGRAVIWNGRTPGDVVFHRFSSRGRYGTNHYRLGFFCIYDGQHVKELIETALVMLEEKPT